MEAFEVQSQYAKPMSVKDWVVTLIITIIPLVGIIMLFVWAFGSNENPTRQNWAKAQLVLVAIAIVLVILFMMAFGAMFAAAASRG
ncbi:MAG: hypothetical protein EOO48_04295 [Flavobacterium sp.]|nr:MAG: hypothetical protein EOO48_04295 [Flavobacterium sp.]